MGKSKQTSTQTRDPFAPALPGIESVLGQAQGLNRDRALAPTDPSTLDAATLLDQIAGQESLGGISQSGISFAEDLFGGGTVGTDTLRQFAGGELGLSGDPRFQQSIENQQIDTSDIIRRITAAAGRAGSPAETGILSRELGKIGLDRRFAQENVDLDRRSAAAGTLASGGAGAIGNVNSLQGSQLFGPALLQQAGGIRQGAEQTELDDLMQRVLQQQGVFFNAANLGGTSSGTQTTKANPVTQGINLLSALSGFMPKGPAAIPA